MEMNFPHQDVDWTEQSQGNELALDNVDLHTLLAFAIVRQESGLTVQSYFALKQGFSFSDARAERSLLEDRMAFFSNSGPIGKANENEAGTYGTGSFRPDLAQSVLEDAKNAKSKV